MNFEFKSYETTVNIEGKEYTLNCSADTGDYLREKSEELRSLAAEFSAGKKSKSEVIDFGCDMIDHLLGAGAAKQILTGVHMRIDDIADVCAFLSLAAAKYYVERRRICAEG